MKKHMREAYHELNAVGKLAIKDSSSNMLAKMTEYQERLTEDIGEKLASIVQSNIMAALESLNDKENIVLITQANVVTNDCALLDIIDKLTKKVEALGSQITNQ